MRERALYRTGSTLRRWWPLGVVCLSVFVVLGCASAARDTATFDPAAPDLLEPPLPTAQTGPVEIATLELRELAPGAELELIADGPLVWTQYRDQDAHLVVELPNTVLAAGVTGLQPFEGLVSAVDVETEEGERPLTRLTIRTRQEAEHSLVVDDRILSLRLQPVVAGEAAPAIAFEPLPEEEPAAEIAVAQPPPVLPRGTPDEPVIAPSPQGVPATRLDGVELVSTGATTVVRVVGDGEFDYSTFSLDNPARFVIDLEGVVNTSVESTVPVDSDAVTQIRMAQFRPHPNPVSRVVFDLVDGVPPSVERTGEALVVRFGGAAARPAMARASEELVLEPVEPAPQFDEPTIEVAQTEPPEPDRPEVEVEVPLSERAQPEPLQFADQGAQEAPREPPPPFEPPSDVRLFEAQETASAAPPEGTSETTVPFGVQDVTGATQWVGEPISMSLKDADITEVLRSIARIANLNIVIQPGVSGPVTVELDRVPWDQALDQILKINNLGQQLDGNILRIAPTSQLRAEAQERQLLAQAKALSVPLKTVLKRVSYADAQAVATILTTGAGSDARFGGLPTGIMSQRGTVSVDDRTNTLIIKELPDFLDTVIQIIENLDVPEKQVMIEARIVETSRSFSRTLGIQWSFNGVADAVHGNTTGLDFPNNITTNGGVNLLTGGQTGFLNFGLGNVLNTFELDFALNAAENDGLVNVISTPKVATLNNQSAFIQTGLQIPIQTVANNTVTVQFVNATLRLEVTPQVTADGTILMDISIQKREPQLAFAVVGATNAPISTREARTRVIVRDGGTTVIGGIYEVSNDQGEDRVPGLANIPVLGWLFKNKRRSTDNEELLIFITPRVIQL